MPPPEPWCCAACGRARSEVERARAAAGRTSLSPEAMACGQHCALALVERELASAEALARECAPAASLRFRPREERVYVPGRVAYVSVVQLEPCTAAE
jgi:hypothetical protein